MHRLFPRWPRLDVQALVLRGGTRITLQPGQYFSETARSWRRSWLDGKEREYWAKGDVRRVVRRKR